MWEAPLWTRNFRPGPRRKCRQPPSLGAWGGGGGLKPGAPCPPLPAQCAEPPTFGVVPVDSFPNQGLALPERHPQQVVGPTADLNRLPRGVYQGPRRAFGIVVADVLSVPHLGGNGYQQGQARAPCRGWLPELGCVCTSLCTAQAWGSPEDQGFLGDHPGLPHLAPAAIQSLEPD